MVETAKGRNMQYQGHPVQTFQEVKKSWCSQHDFEAIHNVNEVCYGYFDENKGWELLTEEECMRELNWAYNNSISVMLDKEEDEVQKSELKGFMVRLITNVKGDLVKQLQRYGMAVHGLKVIISRPSKSTNEKNKFCKSYWGKCFVLKDPIKTSDNDEWSKPKMKKWESIPSPSAKGWKK